MTSLRFGAQGILVAFLSSSSAWYYIHCTGASSQTLLYSMVETVGLITIANLEMPSAQAHLARRAMRPDPRQMQTNAKVIRLFEAFIIRGLRRIS